MVVYLLWSTEYELSPDELLRVYRTKEAAERAKEATLKDPDHFGNLSITEEVVFC